MTPTIRDMTEVPLPRSQWPKYFQRTTPNTQTCWGYTFEWTDKHLTLGQIERLKASYDVLAEECLEILEEISPPPSRGTLPRNASSTNTLPQTDPSAILPTPAKEDEKPAIPHRDLYTLLRDHRTSHPKLQELWDQITTVPAWVDWDQISRGQDVFYRYGGPIFTGLAYQSLLGGMGAARVVETLARTGGFSAKAARRRLFETTQHILQCTRSVAAMQPGGEGVAATVRVRLLHAAVRRRIMRLAADRPEYYSVAKHGIPINDLDTLGTIATFSATLLWLSLPRQGIFCSAAEVVDYLALWRYIGYVIGAPTEECFRDAAQSQAAMESLLYYEIRPTETSALLAGNIIRSLADQPPSYASADMLVASARWMNGNELCDRLRLPRPGWYYSALMAGQCSFFMFWGYLSRVVPSWDKKKMVLLRKAFYQIIVESNYGLQGKETLFDFKYVPELSTITEQIEQVPNNPSERRIEWRNLKALMWALAGISIVSWCGWKIASGVVGLGLRLATWL